MLDERFLRGSGSRPARRKLPFFPYLHHKISRSGSSRLRLSSSWHDMQTCLCLILQGVPGPKKEQVDRVSNPVHPPLYTVWGARGRPAIRQPPRKRVDLKHSNKPPRRLLQVAADMRRVELSPALLDFDGTLKCICPSLEAPRVAQATSPHRRPLKERDTPGFLPAGSLQFAGSVHAVRDTQALPPVSVSPALTFTASLDHASMHEDAVS